MCKVDFKINPFCVVIILSNIWSSVSKCSGRLSIVLEGLEGLKIICSPWRADKEERKEAQSWDQSGQFPSLLLGNEEHLIDEDNLSMTVLVDRWRDFHKFLSPKDGAELGREDHRV